MDITEDGELAERLKDETNRITKFTTVYISYSAKDKDLAYMLEEKLKHTGYQVLIDKGLMPGDIYENKLGAMIDTAARDGFVLLLITENSVCSRVTELELRYADEAGSLILPIMVGNPEVPELWQFLLNNKQIINISPKPSKAEIDKIVTQLLDMTEF